MPERYSYSYAYPRRGRAVGALAAAGLLEGEESGFAADFTAGAFKALLLRDSVDSYLHADELLTNPSASPKLVRTAAGGLAWTPHNLFLNSGSPATQNVTLVTGETYTVRVTGAGSLAGSSGASGTATEGSDVTFTATGTTGTFTVTDTLATIQLNRGTVATAYLVTAGSQRFGVPITYDARLGGTSLWAEPQATNLCAQSDRLHNWLTNFVASVTADQSDDPLGEHSADLVTGSGSSGLRYSPANLAAGAYAFSIFAAPDNASSMATAVTSSTPTAERRIAQVAFATHAVTTNAGVGTDFTGVDARTETFGPYERLEQRLTTPAGRSDFGYWLAGHIVSTSLQLDNNSRLYGYGAQIEAGAFATSHIPTFGSTATRKADAVQVALSSIASYDAAGNTLLVAARTPKAASATRVLASLDDGTADERIRIERNTSSEIHCIVTDGGVAQADLNLGVVADDTDFAVALAWEANDIAACLDGGAIVTDTGATLPTPTTLRLGHSPAGEEWNGTIKQLVLVPGRKADAWMQARTAGVVALGAPEFWDNFERADNADLGVSPSGHTWLRVAANTPSGNWTEAEIVDGAMWGAESGNTLSASYSAIDLGRKVRRMGAVIRYDGTTNIPSAGLHCTRTFTPAGNGYITGTDDEDGAVHISFADKLAVIAYFDPDEGFVSVKTLNYPAPCALDGVTPYVIGTEIDGDTLTVIYPGGSYTMTADWVGRLAGNYATFEHWRNAPGSAVYFDAVWAES